MASGGGLISVTMGTAAGLAALLAAPLAAQSVNDYRLPGTVTTPAPGSAPGPVDSDVPAVRTPAERPSPQPAATAASAAPSASPSASPAAADPRRETTRQAPAVQPRAERPQPSQAEIQPRAAASVAPTAPAPQTPVSPAPLPTTPAPIATATAGPSGTTSETSPLWPWGALVLALLIGGAGGWLLHRRRSQPLAITFEPPVVAPREPETPRAQPPEPVDPAPATSPPSEPPAAPSPVAPAPQGLTLDLEARRMSASLMATTLSYTLRLTNNGALPLAALAVEGDMISAHASLPPEQQIASGNHKLELRHAAVELAPGQSAEFTGDFRLPLSAVTPIRAGDAAYFVPLARFRVEASLPGGGSQVLVQTFVVGEVPGNPGAALRPFRLDLGPRVYSRIGQRAVA